MAPDAPAIVVESMLDDGAVRTLADELVGEFPGLAVHGVVGDVERHLHALPEPDAPRLVAFLGGTISNFIPGTRRRFLRSIAALLRPEDALLLGTGLVKDTAVEVAAYDDAAGVTAAFNRNLITVPNRELDGDLPIEAFEHVALFDEEHCWVEMRLRAKWQVRATLRALGHEVEFAAGEEMRTEISAKFTPDALREDLTASGLEMDAFLADPDALYALSLSSVASSSGPT